MIFAALHRVLSRRSAGSRFAQLMKIELALLLIYYYWFLACRQKPVRFAGIARDILIPALCRYMTFQKRYIRRPDPILVKSGVLIAVFDL